MREFLEEYWPAALGVLVAAGAVVFALLSSLPVPVPKAGAPAAEAGAGEAQGQGKYTPGLPTTAEDFWARLRERAPYVEQLAYRCPCDNTKLVVNAIQQQNVLGGVATDFMAIQLKAPAEALGRPDLSLQLFNNLQVVCPEDLATFEYMDLSNLANGLVPNASANLHGWKLADDAPELAAIPYEQWTSPERHLAHYFTLVRAGFPDYEIGWRVLAGAHAANFAVWHGDEYAIPSPVFYALAALHLRRELDNPDSRMNDDERSSTALLAAELFRLLGRGDDALYCYGKLEGLKLYPKQQEALDLLKQKIADGDYTLTRDTVVGIEAPPVGWYIDEMMPAINSHIQEHRPHWNTQDDPALVARQACGLLVPPVLE